MVIKLYVMKNLFLFIFIAIIAKPIYSQCTPVIRVEDSYGDGWNGAFISIFYDDVYQTFLNCPSGYSWVDYILPVIPDGQTMSVAFFGGSWDNEITYKVDVTGDGTYEGTFTDPPTGFNASFDCGAQDPCKVLVQMFDTGGNGWTGATITGAYDGVLESTISVEAADYDSNVEKYVVPACAELSLTYTAGSWEAQNAYYVYRNGSYEFTDEGTPTPGNSYNYTCPGVSSSSIFYSKSTGNLNELSTWGENIDGTGCPPANFTTAGVTYNVHNNTAPTTSGAWAVSGAGTKVVFGDPDVTVSFTAGGALDFDCDIELANDGTLNLDDNNMDLEGDLIRSSASAVFNPGPSGTNTITFDGGTNQYVNVTTAGGSTPADADLTFYDVVVNNNSTVRLYYKFSNSKKLNINDLNVNSGSTLHFISD